MASYLPKNLSPTQLLGPEVAVIEKTVYYARVAIVTIVLLIIFICVLVGLSQLFEGKSVKGTVIALGIFSGGLMLWLAVYGRKGWREGGLYGAIKDIYTSRDLMSMTGDIFN